VGVRSTSLPRCRPAASRLAAASEAKRFLAGAALSATDSISVFQARSAGTCPASAGCCAAAFGAGVNGFFFGHGRERDPADQRRTVVQATAKGRKLVEKLSAHHRGALRLRWKSHWASKSWPQLYALLDELIELEQPE
jgi:hypothetical protein